LKRSLKLPISTERTLFIQTHSSKEFEIQESGQITAINNDEGLGLVIGFLHRPIYKLTLLSTVFSMFKRLPAEELLRQLAVCMDKPNSWPVMTEANGQTVVWPEAVNGFRVQRGKALAVQAN
jgi:hypothetical protein